LPFFFFFFFLLAADASAGAAAGWLAGLLVIGSAVMLVGDVSEVLGGPSVLALSAKLVLGAFWDRGH